MKVNQKDLTPETLKEQLGQLGVSLRSLRLFNRVTHDEAARACGFSRQTVSRIERGDPSVAVGQVARYADFLKASKAFSIKVPDRAPLNPKGRVRRRKDEPLTWAAQSGAAVPATV